MAEVPSDFRTSFARLGRAQFVSQGHAAGRWTINVWANALAAEALASRSRDVPVGATVVQEHIERDGDGATAPTLTMVMQKKAKGFAPARGDWAYGVVTSRGQRVASELLDACASCHNASPMDGLFPLPE